VKKLIIFIVLPLLLLGGAGAAALFMGLVPGFGGGEAAMEAPAAEVSSDLPPSYEPVPPGSSTYTFPEFVINLRSKRSYPVFLLLSLTVEVPGEGSRAEVVEQEPRIRDEMIVYLSSLSPSDLNGYDSIEKVRAKAWEVLKAHVDRDDLLNIQVAKMTVK